MKPPTSPSVLQSFQNLYWLRSTTIILLKHRRQLEVALNFKRRALRWENQSICCRNTRLGGRANRSIILDDFLHGHTNVTGPWGECHEKYEAGISYRQNGQRWYRMGEKSSQTAKDGPVRRQEWADLKMGLRIKLAFLWSFSCISFCPWSA